MNITTSSQAERLIGKRYEEKGYAVTFGPGGPSIPFDLGGYIPDILAIKGDEKLLIEVKSRTSGLSADKYRQVDEEVQKHPGWRFLIVTVSDPEFVEPGSGSPKPSVSVEKIKQQLAKIDKIAVEDDLATLVVPQLWTVYVNALRMLSDQSESDFNWSDLSFLNQSYSTGLISYEEYEAAKRLMVLRNSAAHSLDALATKSDVLELRSMIDEVLTRLKQKETVISRSG